MKVWVVRQWTNADGQHEIGDEVEVASGSDQEKHDLQRLISDGIVSTSPVLSGSKSSKRA